MLETILIYSCRHYDFVAEVLITYSEVRLVNTPDISACSSWKVSLYLLRREI